MNNFSLSLTTADDIIVLRPSGYVDSLGAEQLEVASSEALGKGLRKLVVNFSETQFINSVSTNFTSFFRELNHFKALECTS